MMKSPLSRLGVLAALALCRPITVWVQIPESVPASDPHAFLAWSMDRYKALPSFQSEMDWSMAAGDTRASNAKRLIQYASPNRFKVVSTNGSGFIQTSVSDGKTLIEYASAGGMGAQKYNAPASLDRATSMQMMHPMFCGTLLYQFFGGSANFPALISTTKNHALLRFGPDVTMGGERCKTVKFYAATGTYGNVQMAIAPRDGLVRQILYDSAPLLEQMRQTAKETHQPTPFDSGMTLTTTERYQKIQTDATFADNTFDTIPPATAGAVTSVAGGEKPDAPVALKENAPEIKVTPLAGGPPVSLASFRGQVVLIDFWATWCGPCVRGLPETQALHKEFGGKGLTVLAVSDEDAATINGFLKAKGFGSLPVYRDTDKTAERAYKVTAIPTVAVIDRQGRLSALFVGLQEPATIRQALKQAGLEIPEP